MFPKRDTKLFRFQVPACRLDTGLRHPVAASTLHEVEDVRRERDILPDHHRREDLFRRHPSRVGPLVRVTRHFPTRDLAPAFAAFLVADANKDDPPFVRPAKAGLEELDKREIDLEEFNGAYFHNLFQTTAKENNGATKRPASFTRGRFRRAAKQLG